METVSFATARRGTDGESVAHARALLKKGYGYQNTALISGVNETLLRQLCGPAKLRASTPVPVSPPRLPKALPVVRAARAYEEAPSCSDDTTAIIDRVAAKYGLARRDLIGPNRGRFIAFARQEAMACVRRERGHLSYPTIGRIFGGRDHTTIMHGEARHLERAAWADVLTVFATLSDQLDLFAIAA